MYRNQAVAIYETVELEANIKSGVLQGCSLTPALFSVPGLFKWNSDWVCKIVFIQWIYYEQMISPRNRLASQYTFSRCPQIHLLRKTFLYICTTTLHTENAVKSFLMAQKDGNGLWLDLECTVSVQSLEIRFFLNCSFHNFCSTITWVIMLISVWHKSPWRVVFIDTDYSRLRY